MTSRALDILRKVDHVAAEDTRNTGKLLKHYDIHTHLISSHEHNQEKAIPYILSLIEQGDSIAIVSDAGYPLLSDPGQHLVEELIRHSIPVISISGANAALNALVASGLSCYHYLFYGFLDSKSSKERKNLKLFLLFHIHLFFMKHLIVLKPC